MAMIHFARIKDNVIQVPMSIDDFDVAKVCGGGDININLNCIIFVTHRLEVRFVSWMFTKNFKNITYFGHLLPTISFK